MTCFNPEIEWNYAYLKKIRLSFYRKLKDVKFAFKEGSAAANARNVTDIELLLIDELPKVIINFIILIVPFVFQGTVPS